LFDVLPRNLRSSIYHLFVFFLFVLVSLTLINEAMVRGLGHDEHQFVASGRLLADEGLLPYRDYPYFHTPYLTFIYAAIYRFTSFNLMPARLFSVLSALGGLGLVYSLTVGRLRGQSSVLRLGIPSVSVLMLVFNPIFRYTSGQAWNHDLPILLTLLAFLAWLRSNTDPRWLFLSGALVGFAVGVRLSFLVIAPPFLLISFFASPSGSNRKRLGRPGWFTIGLVLSLLPLLAVALTAPRAFLFGNLEYIRLNTLFRLEMGFDERMDLAGKLSFLIEVIAEPGSLPLFAGYILISLASLPELLRKGGHARWAVLLIHLVVISLFAAALVPTPAWPQYFFAPLPWMTLGVAFGLSLLLERALSVRWLFGAFALAGAVVVLFGWQGYPSIQGLTAPHRWATLRIHRIGEEINRQVGQGKVLTLAPIYPLEGGVEIFPSLTTGPFAWRTAGFVSDSARRQFGVLAPENLERTAEKEILAGILVGPEGELEGPFLDLARGKAYRSVILADDLTLFIPPSRSNP
jgi:hypothetical protein